MVDISILRNLVFIIPGVNLAAFVFEAYFSIKDRQGIRLGDKFAMTQVVEGKKIPELAKLFQMILSDFHSNGFVDETSPQRAIAQKELFNSIKRQGIRPPIDLRNMNGRVVSVRFVAKSIDKNAR